MDAFFLIASVVVLMWAARRFAFSLTGLWDIGGFFVGFRPDGWPVGVQEEDRDQPWGRKLLTRKPPEVELKPTIERVRPAVHVR